MSPFNRGRAGQKADYLYYMQHWNTKLRIAILERETLMRMSNPRSLEMMLTLFMTECLLLKSTEIHLWRTIVEKRNEGCGSDSRKTLMARKKYYYGGKKDVFHL